MPSSLGPAEIIVILVVALIVLGPKRLPEAGRQVGKALSEIRRWTADMKSEMTSAFDADQATANRPPVIEPQPQPEPQPPATEPAASDAVEERLPAPPPPEVPPAL